MLHKLAMNALGICCVPVNPDYRPRELAYLIDHAHVDLAVVLESRWADWQAGAARPRGSRPPSFSSGSTPPCPASTSATNWTPEPTPASILYTSGTTSRPKAACCPTARAGRGATTPRGGLVDFEPEGERIYNPLLFP
jgi:crotonobetaine/carnitine-CoA ligase